MTYDKYRSWKRQSFTDDKIKNQVIKDMENEYQIVNCARCGKPVVKIHRELLTHIKEAIHYDEEHGPHFYHVDCPGGFEAVGGSPSQYKQP